MEVLEQEGLARVGAWDSLATAQEHALVVLAMRRDCWVLGGEGGYEVHVDPADEAAVRDEFELYAVEQGAPAPMSEVMEVPAGIGHALLWIAALSGMFVWQQRDPSLVDRFCNSREALFGAGEWWRPFTSLFLHADGAHLLGNLAIGGIFCLFVVQSLGAWRGWAMILASGLLGNVAAAAARGPDYRAIGASTATFGALGILVGLGLVLAWRARRYRSLSPLVAPLGAGVVLLGWFGSSGEQTDVLAHLFGWGVGLMAGAAAGMLAHAGKRNPAG